MKKRFYLIPMLAPLVIAACAPLDAPTCGGTVEVAPVLLTKEGFQIINDQAPLPIPCPEIGTAITISTPPILPPVEPPVVEPPVEPPIEPPVTPPKPESPCTGNPGNEKCVGKAGEKDFEDDEGDVRGNSN